MKVSIMDVNEMIINLPSLVDLALGHPEIGAVNFNIMQCVLHTILKESGLYGTELAFRGQDAERLKHLEKIHPIQSHYILSDYTISGKEKKDEPKSHKILVQSGNKLDELEEKVNKINDTLFQLLKMPTNDTLIRSVQSTALYSITSHIPDDLPSDLQSDLPSERLVDETGVMPTPTNMWHLLTVEKRVEAAEEGIDKLTSLVESLVQQNTYGKSAILTNKELDPYKDKDSKQSLKDIQTTCELMDSSYNEMLQNINDHMTALTERILNLESRYVEIVGYEPTDLSVASTVSDTYEAPSPTVVGTTSSQDTKKTKASDISDFDELDDETTEKKGDETSGKKEDKTSEKNIKDSVVKDTTSKFSMKKNLGKFKDRSITEVNLEELLGRKGSLFNALNEIDDLKKSYKQFKKQLSAVMLREEKQREKEEQRGEDFESICERIEPCLEKCREQINQLDTMFNHQIEEVRHQIASMEIELGALLEKVNTSVGGGDPGDAGGFTDVYNKLARIQNELAQITALTSNLQDDKDEKEAKIEALMESIDFLKSIKADKEDIEDALANKADQQHVNRKVSHDQFDAACDDLSRNLEDALLKLTQQEEFWNETLEAIQAEIENKLDKNDIQPLHDFVTGKLKTLHQRLQALAAFKRDAEAAGTKTRLLKDVNCVSCDKPAVMLREAKIPSIPEESALPPNRSMKPYLTYELDNARKQRRKGLIYRNLNNLEITKEQSQVADNRDIDNKIMATDHLCNRYCGGSHTVTAPSQRVTHMSHYLQTQGPLTTVPLTEGFTKGNDGKIYKARQEESHPPSTIPPSAAPSRATENQFGDPAFDEGNVKNLGITTLYKPCTCKPNSAIRISKKPPIKGPVKNF